MASDLDVDIDMNVEKRQLNINGDNGEEESLEETLGLNREVAGPANLATTTINTDSFRDSKFAQILGFGFFRSETAAPATMDTLEILSDDEDIPPPPSSARSSVTNAPLEPSFYQIGMRMADTQWAMNYQEASIFIEEGANNDQFSTHPKRKESLPAYILAHTSWFYLLDLTASLVLLFLAAAEAPAVDALQLPIGVHASLEIGALSVIILGLILKLRWLGVKNLVSHHRTLLKVTALVVMMVEAVIVLGRQSSHFRITRALRPIFLVDNRYCRGVRRFTREVLQSLPPILDMLLLLLFFILIFTLLGHFLFGHDPNDPFFSTLDDSFVNLFVLLTTANYPDVMMPAYFRNRWSVLFFVAYLVTVLYMFMNLLLAVVYDTFTTLEKEKFRKLVIHKRKACHFAFNLLVSKSNTNGIIFRHFYGMMTQYKSKKSLRDIYLTFKALDKSGDGVLTREEFCRFYESANLKWKPLKIAGFQRQWPFFKETGVYVQRFLNSPFADYLFNGVIALNTVAMIARWAAGQTSHGSWDSYIFALWFLLEMGIKILTWGFPRVLSSGWHSFDLIASLAFMFSIIMVKILPSWDELLTFIRPLRLLRLFKLKKRYRDVFGTLFILIPPMSSAAVVILLLYYFFAIIGMELFSGVNLKNCCNGTLLEPYYAEPALNASNLHYYLNTFSNLFASAVTLFELTVVNNWYVIMEGHAMVTSRYSRIYFIVFYLVTMVLLTIIVAFILDTFLFRIQYKRAMDRRTEEKMLRTEVSLTGEEIDFCYRQYAEDPHKRLQILQDYGEDLATKGCVTYVGFRVRTKEILFKRMFRHEIPDWLRETDPILGVGLHS